MPTPSGWRNPYQPLPTVDLPPVVPQKPVLLVDFDATLFPWAPLYQDNPPIPGAVYAMKALRDAGFELQIFSSRLSRTWLMAAKESYAKNIDHMSKLLNRYDIPFDGFATEKIPALAYIDDRAIEFKNNWKQIADRLVPLGPLHEHVWFNVSEDESGDLQWRPDGSDLIVCSCGAAQ